MTPTGTTSTFQEPMTTEGELLATRAAAISNGFTPPPRVTPVSSPSQPIRRGPSLRDVITGILAFVITGGFMGVLTYMVRHGVPKEGGEVLLVLLGSLGTAWATVISYYFGSSAGSAEKTRQMVDAIQQHPTQQDRATSIPPAANALGSN
jgi:uncharacterized membrane protein YeaQ/YmgE (transglycosylase-associated protein family)